ncbi:hypothetical protein OBV_15440 [Oscillibacter valericigenes Sjm18-20]|nr:hypothetical protein OBV_15440 [Oscillibacter valericigenes Sjm18-20]
MANEKLTWREGNKDTEIPVFFSHNPNSSTSAHTIAVSLITEYLRQKQADQNER